MNWNWNQATQKNESIFGCLFLKLPTFTSKTDKTSSLLLTLSAKEFNEETSWYTILVWSAIETENAKTESKNTAKLFALKQFYQDPLRIRCAMHNGQKLYVQKFSILLPHKNVVHFPGLRLYHPEKFLFCGVKLSLNWTASLAYQSSVLLDIHSSRQTREVKLGSIAGLFPGLAGSLCNASRSVRVNAKRRSLLASSLILPSKSSLSTAGMPCISKLCHLLYCCRAFTCFFSIQKLPAYC